MMRSLVDMCVAVAARHASQITDIAELPYKTLEPALLNIRSAEQLNQLEQNSPQIIGEDWAVWKAVIEHRFPHLKTKGRDGDLTDWSSEVYDQLVQDEEEKEANAIAALEATFKGINKAKIDNKSKIANVSALPRGRRLGTGFVPRNLTFGGGSRTKMTDSASILRRVKREAAEIAARRNLANRNVTVRPGQITEIPQAILNARRIASQPAFNPPEAPKKRSIEDAGLAEKEARLLQLKKHKASATNAVLAGRASLASTATSTAIKKVEANSTETKKSLSHPSRPGGLLWSLRKPPRLTSTPKPVIRTVTVAVGTKSSCQSSPTSSTYAQESRSSQPRGSESRPASAQTSRQRPNQPSTQRSSQQSSQRPSQRRPSLSLSPPSTPGRSTNLATKAQMSAPSPPKSAVTSPVMPADPKPASRKKPVDIFMRTKKKIVR